jgi:zinc protease
MVPAADVSTVETFLPPEPPGVPVSFTLPRAKEQTHIIVGFLGTTLTSADRFAVEVMDTILSGQSGRLFSELRDKKSLAYSLSAFSLLGLDTGSLGVYIGTSPEKRDEAVEALWQELRRLRDTLPGEEELTRAKNVLIGQYELGVQTHGAQAMEMALNEVYGLGQDFGNRYVAGIGRVDARAVRDAAMKYILLDQSVRVTVGAVDAFGKARSADNPPPETPEATPGDGNEP